MQRVIEYDVEQCFQTAEMSARIRTNVYFRKIKINIEKSVFSGQQEVEHVEEHLVIIGCTNNVPAPSLFSNSSEVNTRNG